MEIGGGGILGGRRADGEREAGEGGVGGGDRGCLSSAPAYEKRMKFKILFY